MVPTRRQVLGGGAALLAALAGCNGSPDRPTSSATAGRDRDSNTVAVDPPAVKLRGSASTDPVVEVADADGGSTRTDRERRRALRRGFVTTDEAASLLRVDDVEGAESARRFLAETDFETSFVFLDRGSVQQCYEQSLCHVTRSPSELWLTYAEVYRDYDVECSTSERDSVAWLIRLKGPVDPRQVESGGTRTHRGGCPVPRRQRGTTRADDATDGATDTSGDWNAARTARFGGWDR